MPAEQTRLLRSDDAPALLELCHAAGWNQTTDDWLRLLSLEPEGCFGIESAGRIVATATAVTYGRELAWIGMVLTHGDFRGRGLGSHVTARAVEYSRERGVAAVKLDATDMGRPLYLRLGFTGEAPVQRWTREPSLPPAASTSTPALGPFGYDAHLDRRAFGADRSALMSLIAHEGFSCGDGFVACRAGSRALQIGPCVARSLAAARTLMSAVLSRHSGEMLYWDVLPANQAAVALAGELGFAPARTLERMVYSPQGQIGPTHDDSLVYATAGFEYG